MNYIPQCPNSFAMNNPAVKDIIYLAGVDIFRNYFRRFLWFKMMEV
jgi:hypothetical protein